MAFGDLLGTLSGSAGSITNPTDATGSVVVSVGDLIFVAYGERGSLTGASVTDNLGNTYTAQNAGTDGGNAAGRAWYSIVTTGGTLTTVHLAATASSDDVAIAVACFAGPFAASPVDANPANGSADITSPYDCPATGTLAQASELVLGWIAVTNGRAATSTSPFALAKSVLSGSEGGANSASASINYEVVSSTSSVAPQFTFAGGTINSSVLGTISFKAGGGTSLSPGQGNLALSTTAPSRVIDVRRDPGQGNLALSTTAPTLVQDAPRNPASANLALSTTAPTLAITDNRDLSPAAGNLVLSTTAPTLAVSDNRDLSPVAADLALSTTAPSIVIGYQLTPASADLAFSTFAPTVTVDFRFTPVAANLALSTTVPTVLVDYRRDPASGNLALSTTAPTVAWTDHHFATPAAADLALSTTAPTVALTANRDLSPATAQVGLSTTAPTVDVTSASDKTPAAAQLALSTTAPTVAISDNRSLSPGAVDLALSTTAPTVEIAATSANLSPGAAQLSLSTTAPTVEIAASVVVRGGGGDKRRKKKTVQAAKAPKLKAETKRKKKRKDEDEKRQVEAPKPLDELPPLPIAAAPELPPVELAYVEPEKSPLPPMQPERVEPEPEQMPLPPERPRPPAPPEELADFVQPERSPVPAPPLRPIEFLLPSAAGLSAAQDEEDALALLQHLPTFLQGLADRDQRDLEDMARVIERERQDLEDIARAAKAARDARDTRDLEDITRAIQSRPVAVFKLVHGPDGSIIGATVEKNGQTEQIRVGRDMDRQISTIQRTRSRRIA